MLPNPNNKEEGFPSSSENQTPKIPEKYPSHNIRSSSRLWKNSLRGVLWSAPLILAILLSQKIQKSEHSALPEQEKKELARKMAGFWEMQKIKTYEINDAAQKYTQAHQLKPGDPLSPNQLYQAENPTLRLLTKPARMQIVSQFTASSKSHSATATSLIAINSTVPKPPEKYAYCGVLWSSQITGTTIQTYPKDTFALRKLHQAQKEVEIKMQEKKNAKP